MREITRWMDSDIDNTEFNESIALESSRTKQSVRTEQNFRTKKLIKIRKLLE